MPTETRVGGLWYHDRYLVDGLAEALTNAEVFGDASDVTAFLKKPQRYNEFYDAWEAANFPTSDEDDNWDDFVEAVSGDDEDESDDT
jgi:hypothetical protein